MLFCYIALGNFEYTQFPTFVTQIDHNSGRFPLDMSYSDLLPRYFIGIFGRKSSTCHWVTLTFEVSSDHSISTVSSQNRSQYSTFSIETSCIDNMPLSTTAFLLVFLVASLCFFAVKSKFANICCFREPVAALRGNTGSNLVG